MRLENGCQKCRIYTYTLTYTCVKYTKKTVHRVILCLFKHRIVCYFIQSFQDNDINKTDLHVYGTNRALIGINKA